MSVDVTVTRSFKDPNYFDNLNPGSAYVYSQGGVATPVSAHNVLTSIQGGTSSEYYHFTAAEHTELVDWVNNGISLDEINAPSGDWAMTLANKQLKYTWVAPPDADEGAFELEITGAFVGDLMHLHQKTGNPGADTHLIHMIAEDADVEAMAISLAASTSTALELEVNADDNYRFELDASGKMVWGDGTDPTDTNLYRGGVGMLVTDSKFGIGTDTPSGKLQIVTGDVNGGSVGATWGDKWVVIGETGAAGKGIAFGYDSSNSCGVIVAAEPDVLYHDLALNPVLGNVGIGTVTPLSKLHISGADGTSALIQSTVADVTDATTYLYFKTLSGATDLFKKAAILVHRADSYGYGKGDLHFAVDTAADSGNAVLADSKMMIDGNTGYVGIGVSTTPDAKLEINQASVTKYGLEVAMTANGNYPAAIFKANTSGNEGDPTYGGGEVAVFKRNTTANHGSSIALVGGSTGSATVMFGDKDDIDIGKIVYDHTDDYMEFYSDATTALKISSTQSVGHASFTSGFQGTNWQIEADGDAEFRNVLISGGLQVYELIINRLRYQNGGLIIGAGAGKIKTVHTATQGSEVLEFEDPEGTSMVPFTVGAILLCQDVDINRTSVVKKIVRQVASISSQEITLTTTAGWVIGSDVGAFGYGDEVVAIGHVSDTDLDANIYMSAVDSDNPFMRVYDGVDSYDDWSLGTKTTIKVQLGNLESLASYGIVPASPGFGLYSDNVYLTGKIVATSGTIGGWTVDSEKIEKNVSSSYLRVNAADATYPIGFSLYMDNSDISVGDIKIVQMGGLYTAGNSVTVGSDYGFQIKKLVAATPTYADIVYMGADAITIGGWNVDSDAIYTGTKSTTDNFGTDGITLSSDGSIHAEYFFMNATGGFAAQDLLITTAIGNIACVAISGGDIHDSQITHDGGGIKINYNGYDDGTTYFRDLHVYDGKNNLLFDTDGSADEITFWANTKFESMFNYNLRYVTAGTTLTDADNVLICNNGSSATVYLPTTKAYGDIYIIKRMGSGAVTLDHNGSSQIRNLNGNDVDTISMGTQQTLWVTYVNYGVWVIIAIS